MLSPHAENLWVITAMDKDAVAEEMKKGEAVYSGFNLHNPVIQYTLEPEYVNCVLCGDQIV